MATSATRLLPLLLSAAAALCLPACVTRFDSHRASLPRLFEAGRYDLAAAELDRQETLADYGEKDKLLWWLERGGVALALDDHPKALDALGKAEDFMELAGERSPADSIAQWLLNDTAAPYVGEPYEDIYVNTLKLLAQLERGELLGGATVEARRAADKAQRLRDRFLTLDRAIQDRGAEDQGFAAAQRARAGLAERNDAGEFIESTLAAYLTAVTFMKTGDASNQAVAGRRLLSAIDLQRGLIGPVSDEHFRGIGDARPDSANTLLVALSGRGPTKTPERIGPIPIYTYTLYFELPQLVGGSADAARARAIIQPVDPPSGEAREIDLHFIEDFRAVAKANHQRQLPLIYARTILRSSLKAAAFVVGTEAARRATARKESAQAAVEIAGIIGGLLFVTATEKADLRSWVFLPGQAHVALAELPPGTHAVRVEYLTNTGALLYAAPARTITVGPSPTDLATVVEHWWR